MPRGCQVEWSVVKCCSSATTFSKEEKVCRGNADKTSTVYDIRLIGDDEGLCFHSLLHTSSSSFRLLSRCSVKWQIGMPPMTDE